MARRIRIVVGEGRTAQRGLLRFVLEGEGFDVVGEARSSADLSGVIEQQRPDVVVLDDGIGVMAVSMVHEVHPQAKVVLVWPSAVVPIGGDARVEPAKILRGPRTGRGARCGAAAGLAGPSSGPIGSTRVRKDPATLRDEARRRRGGGGGCQAPERDPVCRSEAPAAPSRPARRSKRPVRREGWRIPAPLVVLPAGDGVRARAGARHRRRGASVPGWIGGTVEERSEWNRRLGNARTERRGRRERAGAGTRPRRRQGPGLAWSAAAAFLPPGVPRLRPARILPSTVRSAPAPSGDPGTTPSPVERRRAGRSANGRRRDRAGTAAPGTVIRVAAASVAAAPAVGYRRWWTGGGQAGGTGGAVADRWWRRPVVAAPEMAASATAAPVVAVAGPVGRWRRWRRWQRRRRWRRGDGKRDRTVMPGTERRAQPARRTPVEAGSHAGARAGPRRSAGTLARNPSRSTRTSTDRPGLR